MHRSGASAGALGAYEVYADRTTSSDHVTADDLAHGDRRLRGPLVLLTRARARSLARCGARRHAAERTEPLRDSYRLLAESSLDAIETLNATVEAKDPYTAGHSQRVRDIALAIGRSSACRGRARNPRRARTVPRRGQDRRPRRNPDQAGEARHRGVRDDQGARRARRRDRGEALPPEGRRAGNQAPPRALGRHRLSGPARGRGDSARGVHRRARRRLGRDDDGATVRARPRTGEGHRARCGRDAERSSRPTSSTPSSPLRERSPRRLRERPACGYDPSQPPADQAVLPRKQTAPLSDGDLWRNTLRSPDGRAVSGRSPGGAGDRRRGRRRRSSRSRAVM